MEVMMNCPVFQILVLITYVELTTVLEGKLDTNWFYVVDIINLYFYHSTKVMWFPSIYWGSCTYKMDIKIKICLEPNCLADVWMYHTYFASITEESYKHTHVYYVIEMTTLNEHQSGEMIWH